jgi:transcription antitermination factor NusG
LTADTAHWFALWTSSHCEQLVHDQLSAKRFHVFLPTMRQWSRRAGTKRLISRPMFPGYLFVRHAIDKRSYLDIVSTRGLVKILGERWDSLETIPSSEIEAIERLAESDLTSMPYPYLKEGQRARIVAGPLAGHEGIVVRSRRNRGLLVLSIALLRRSVAVAIEWDAVLPLEASTPVPSAGRLPRRELEVHPS